MFSEVHQKPQANESKIKDVKATVNLMGGISIIFGNYVVTFVGYFPKVLFSYWKHINHFFFHDNISFPLGMYVFMMQLFSLV